MASEAEGVVLQRGGNRGIAGGDLLDRRHGRTGATGGPGAAQADPASAGIRESGPDANTAVCRDGLTQASLTGPAVVALKTAALSGFVAREPAPPQLRASLRRGTLPVDDDPGKAQQ